MSDLKRCVVVVCVCACVDGWNGRCRDALKQRASERDEIGQTLTTGEEIGKRSARLIGAQSLPEGACVSWLWSAVQGKMRRSKRNTEAPKPKQVVMRTDAHG